MTGPVAVVDIGKTTAKLALVDRASGATLDTLTRPNRPRPGPPYPHADVDGLWSFIREGLARFAAAHPVAGVAVTTHGATAALVAGDGLALPVLDYEHDGPDAVADAYDRVRPDFAETLSPRLPAGLNLGAQLFWQARAFPDGFARAEAILAYPQFWAWRLTGIGASEATSLGCHTDLWAPTDRGLSSLVEREGWRRLFPPLRPAASVLGPLLPEVAAATGLRPGTPVACGIHDSNASLLPWLGRLRPPFTVISSGTWTVVMTVGGTIAGLDPARDSLANVDAFGRPVPTARFMGGREYAAIAGPDPTPATSADVRAVIARGAMALPSFAPGFGPFGAGAGRVEPSGGPAGARRTALADLYLALVTRECLALAGTGARIVVEGPLARNATFCGLVAALAKVPVHPSPDATGTAMGAALLFDPPGAPRDEVPAVAVPPLAVAGLDDYARAWRALAGR